MAGPWEKYGKQAAGPWAKYATPDPVNPDGTIGQPPPEFRMGPSGQMLDMEAVARDPQGAMQAGALQEPYSGGILPFSINEFGEKSFDINAGVPGMIKRALSTPGDVYTGKLDIGPPGRPSLADPEVYGRALESAAIVSTVSPAARASPSAFARRQNPAKVKAPSGETLRKVGGQQLDAYKNSGVYYRPESVRALAARVEQDLLNDSITPATAPATFKILNKLRAEQPAGTRFDAKDVRALIEAVQKPRVGKAGAQDGRAANIFIDHIYRFVERPDPADIVRGEGAVAGQLHQAGRGNYSAGKRSGTITGKVKSAELQAAVANSGQNLGNKYRQRAAGITNPEFPKRAYGFTDKEIAALEKVAEGTRYQNATRAAGNYLGGGGGLGALSASAAGGGLGALIGGPFGAAVGTTVPPLTGAALKGASARSSGKALSAVDEMIRAASPLFRQMKANPPMVQPGTVARALPARLAAALALADRQGNDPDLQRLAEILAQRAAAR